MSFFNKIKWILGILIVFVLIITTNLIDKENFTRLKNTVSVIYEDRLVAKDLIFKISNSIHKKEIGYFLKDELFFKTKNTKVNKELNTLLHQYKQTKLTKDEEALFKTLQQKITLLQNQEKTLGFNADVIATNSYVTNIKAIKSLLSELSKIQITEGSRQVFISKKALSTIELFTQIEIYFLIFLAIIVQIIIVYTPKQEK